MAGALDHSTNTIILDAVLTTRGRAYLARFDGSFQIVKFALTDDEIQYNLIRQYGRIIGKEYIESVNLRLIREPDNNDDLLEKKVLFQKALNQLPEKQKTALLMNKMQGLTYKEIAEVLNLSQKAIEKRIGLALKALKQNLNQR